MIRRLSRLDLFLRKRGEQLDIGMRLGLVRQIAEALQYAHERRLYHQALSPQTILVKAPASRTPQIKIFDWQTARRGELLNGQYPSDWRCWAAPWSLRRSTKLALYGPGGHRRYGV